MAELECRHLGGRSVADFFDLVVGTSTGGIIALGLAKGLTAREILDLYMTRGEEVFPDLSWLKRMVRNVMGYVLNSCDHRALERLIADVVGSSQLWEARKRLCIPSIDATWGDVFVFKTPHHPDFRKDWERPMTLVARATSAAPSFFKPHADGTYEFLDGGIWANNPVMVGLVDALSAFDVSRDRVRILSLGCVEDAYRIGTLHRHIGGKLPWAKNVIDGAMHLQSLGAIGQAGLLIGRDRLTRIDSPPIRPKLELDDWARCRDILPAKAHELADRHAQEVAARFLTVPADPYEPIYTPASPPFPSPAASAS